MKTHPITFNATHPTMQTGQLIPATSTELYNPGSWLKNGDSPAEIILATAILVGAIAGLLSVLVVAKTQKKP